MEYPLDNYEYQDIRYYLDGRYFNRVLNDIGAEGLVETPLIVHFSDNSITIKNYDQIINNMNVSKIEYVRMIIEIENDKQLKNSDQDTYQDYVDGKIKWSDHLLMLSSRHSNLLIFDHTFKNIIRFEPSSSFASSTDSESLNDLLRKTFPEYTLKVHDEHPQYSEYTNQYCNAYVLQYAYNKSRDIKKPLSPTEKEIHHFCKTVEFWYGPLELDDGPDVEFGIYNPYGGVLLGGLGGALVGGAVGGVGGSLLGGVTGAALGGALSTNRSYGPRDHHHYPRHRRNYDKYPDHTRYSRNRSHRQTDRYPRSYYYH